ncbi:MAG: 30S ribosomal protein S20 [Planctomycetota bacterium]|jgi:small subunit ribosomal protein S20|nr:30S ribosomal protein S20 [Planctomycetota bacterium]
MANIKSARKRMRQTVKRTARNRVRKERLKKAVKAYRAALNTGDAAVVGEELKKATRAVDKAGVKGILHKNTVNRRKSRLARMANRLAAAGK